MDAPDDETIAEIKAKYSDRALEQIELDSNGDILYLLMTSPSREEYRKYMTEIGAVKDGDIPGLQSAIERNALAQIRWPARDDVKAVFDKNPGMAQKLGGELNRMAGAAAEVRSKKL